MEPENSPPAASVDRSAAAPDRSASAFDLSVDPLPDSPLSIFSSWFEEARLDGRIVNPTAMALATVDSEGAPQVRLVLCRGFDEIGGRFWFYTHYPSPKGRDLDREGRASAVFHWDPLGRQARISGRVVRASESESDTYFESRHPLSRLSARASEQSAPIASREALLAKCDAEKAQYGVDSESQPIPRPAHWGGFVLEAETIELWSGGEWRMHDRGRWTRLRSDETSATPTAAWEVVRLQP